MEIEMVERLKVTDSENYWELSGESVLNAAIIPEKPKSNEATLIRLTHSNSYCPIDGVNFYIRIGDPSNPTQFNDLDSHNDWSELKLIEELVLINEEEVLRSEMKAPLAMDEEMPWDATFETKMNIPEGDHLIEIKVVCPSGFMPSGVISDWRVSSSES
ncbi:MAG TPA: hypothetical protein PK820_06385 [Candidatus Competibacteraceae bacterium]|nr:hypothetical protein [Candidatus Competibacteraceae bacterium]